MVKNSRLFAQRGHSARCAPTQTGRGLRWGNRACNWRRGVDRAPWLDPPLPPERAQLTGPLNPTETDFRASQVTQTQISAKNENGIFGISALRGLRKVIICHIFGEKKLTNFNAQKILLPSAVHLEERLTVSQSVPEPASRQSDRYTQFGFFLQWQMWPQAAERPLATVVAKW